MMNIMKPRHYFAGFLSLLPFLLFSDVVAAQITHVPSEIFQPTQQKSAPSAVTLKSPISARQKRTQSAHSNASLILEAPTATEWRSMQNQNTNRKALQIGIRRDLSALTALTDWDWQTVSGGKAAHFMITSAQASRVRLLLKLKLSLPEGVEIRLFSPANEALVFGPFTRNNFSPANASGDLTLWTPSMAGEQLGIEVFLSDGTRPADIQLTIPELSHIAFDMKTQQFKSGTTKAFRSCDVSIACAPPEWQETATAVARYIYTSPDGNTYLCSGTLVADADSTTQIPYFLTARHCIGDSAGAASMEFFWFDRESSCGANDANPVQTSGGATLLHSQSSLDSTLVQINNTPPAGVLMSGWSVEPLQAQDAVVGLHHGFGNPKQFSSGTFSNYARLSNTTGGYTVHNDPLGDFLQIHWNQGVTAQGSSGSGLWATIDGQRLLKGNLVGGSSSCSTPDQGDEYARLERFYPYVSNWLGTLATPLQGFLNNSGELQSLTDGVLLGRYLDGVRGAALLVGVTDQSVGIATLTERLSDASAHMDLDQDGLTTRAEDALLLTRYLMGLRGSSLIEGIDLNNSANNTPQSISTAIEAFLMGQ